MESETYRAAFLTSLITSRIPGKDTEHGRVGSHSGGSTPVTSIVIPCRRQGTTACASDARYLGTWDQNLMTEWRARYGGPVVGRPVAHQQCATGRKRLADSQSAGRCRYVDARID